LVIALALAVAGACGLGLGAFLLRRTGNAYRVARLLAVAPQATAAEVVERARGPDAQPRYVKTHGRVTSDEDFPDEAQRPLVFRRLRWERGDGRGQWRVLDEERLAVPFGVEDRGAFVAVDVDALGDGLVVIPRESAGVAREIPIEIAEGLPERLEPDTPVRLRIDQVSAVEQATVCGVPVRGPDGVTRLTAGLGRPLIVSTVEPDAAMRLLAADRRGTVLAAGALLVIGLGLLATAIIALILGA
jgi:hypothetical protein